VVCIRLISNVMVIMEMNIEIPFPTQTAGNSKLVARLPLIGLCFKDDIICIHPFKIVVVSDK